MLWIPLEAIPIKVSPGSTSAPILSYQATGRGSRSEPLKKALWIVLILSYIVGTAQFSHVIDVAATVMARLEKSAIEVDAKMQGKEPVKLNRVRRIKPRPGLAMTRSLLFRINSLAFATCRCHARISCGVKINVSVRACDSCISAFKDNITFYFF